MLRVFLGGEIKNCVCCRREGALFMETTTRYDKQRNTKPKVLEVHHYLGHSLLKGSLVVKEGRQHVQEWTAWSEDALGHKKNG